MLSSLNKKLFISFVSGIAVGYCEYKGKINKLNQKHYKQINKLQDELNKLKVIEQLKTRHNIHQPNR